MPQIPPLAPRAAIVAALDAAGIPARFDELPGPDVAIGRVVLTGRIPIEDRVQLALDDLRTMSVRAQHLEEQLQAAQATITALTLDLGESPF